MSRPKSAVTPVHAGPKANDKAHEEAASAARALATITRETDAKVQVLATHLGYRGDLSSKALMDGARGAKQRLGMAILEFGAYLLLLKEGCDHGSFGQVLADLDIEPRAARYYMAATRRLSKRQTSAVLESLGFSKVVELLALDDEQLEELELGQTGELALDDVATMSIKELRQSVRKSRAERDRYKEVNEELHSELALKKRLKVAATDWPERFKGLMDQAEMAFRAFKLATSSLDAIAEAAMKDEPKSEEEAASLERARTVLADDMLTKHRTAANYLDAVGLRFSQTLGAFASEGLYK